MTLVLLFLAYFTLMLFFKMLYPQRIASLKLLPFHLLCYPKHLSFYAAAATAAKSLQSCPALRDPLDSRPGGSPVPGILQARTLAWVAISFSNAWKWNVKSESEVAQLCPTLRDPMDCSLPGSSIHGMFQARVLEWGAIAFSDPSILMLNSLLCHKAFSDSLDRMNHFYAFSYLVCRGPSHFLRFCFRGNYVFSHFMDHKKGWALKTWCFWILVLEKTLESLLDSKEMKPVNPKGN